MLDNLKAICGGSFLLGNTLIQWLSDADTALKLVGTFFALPAAYFTAQYMYYQQKHMRMKIEDLKLERIRRRNRK